MLRQVSGTPEEWGSPQLQQPGRFWSFSNIFSSEIDLRFLLGLYRIYLRSTTLYENVPGRNDFHVR